MGFMNALHLRQLVIAAKIFIILSSYFLALTSFPGYSKTRGYSRLSSIYRQRFCQLSS